MYALLQAALAWARARQELLALPIGAPDYRASLNALSEAEDALQRAARGWSDQGLMERHDRLEYIAMRARFGAVTSESLGRELGVSSRTIHRYVRILQKRGVPIVGEAGIGYMICKKGEISNGR